MRLSDKPWAHGAVHESFASAKIRSETWTSYGFRLDPEVLADLKERLKSDRRTSGNPMLRQGHYLDAALRHIPEDVHSQIEMAQAFLDDRMGVVEAGKQSTFRVGPVAYALVSTLNQGLQEADYGRRGLYVVSAALENSAPGVGRRGGVAAARATDESAAPGVLVGVRPPNRGRPLAVRCGCGPRFGTGHTHISIWADLYTDGHTVDL